MPILWKDGHIVWRDGNIVWTSDPGSCECCGLPPADCHGNAIFALPCFADLLADYNGDSSGFSAYMATTQVDMTIPSGSFSGTHCTAGLCALDGVTKTLPWNGVNGWRVANEPCGIYQRSWLVEYFCWDDSAPYSTEDCGLYASVSVSGPGGVRVVEWRNRYSTQLNFYTLNESLAFLADSNFGLSDANCNHNNTSPVTVALH